MGPERPPNCLTIVDPDDPRRLIPGHAVRDDGTVFYWSARWSKWIPLKPKVGPHGFRRVRVRVGDHVRELGVARLVLRAFEGPCPLGHEPLHFPDPDQSNNRLDNLRWAPIGSSKVGRMCSGSPPPPPRGETHPNAVLTEADIPEIRRMYRDGFMHAEIAVEFGCDGETIRHVLTGRSWSHVPDPEGPIVMRPKGPERGGGAKARLDWSIAKAIRDGHKRGRSYRELAAESGCSKETVADIVKGRTWRTD
jgi:hypothetical protein